MTETAVRRRRQIGPLQIIAIALVAVLAVVVVVLPLVATGDPLQQDVASKFAGIGTPGHPLGTDAFGRDVFSRVVLGLRTELIVSVLSALFAGVLGTILGLLGGYFGRLAEVATMRVVDIILGFPHLILALLIVTLYGPGPVTLICAMSVIFTPGFARLTYGQVLSVKSMEYVEAASVFGGTRTHNLFKVILPNSMAPSIVQFSLTVPAAILLESGLSFLGLGVVPPAPSLGLMIAEGQRYMSTYPEALLVPGIVIVLVILAFGVLGESLRDWLDPRR
jgi:peptide/nickel transport system permease protein